MATPLHWRATGLTMERCVAGDCRDVVVDYAAALVFQRMDGVSGSVVVRTSLKQKDLMSPDLWEKMSPSVTLNARGNPSKAVACHPVHSPEARNCARMVLNSSRKFDKHGDWHMFLFVISGAITFSSLGTRSRMYADRYWYWSVPQWLERTSR